MSFKVEKPQADFTMVCNAVLRDARLSLRAKGLYALMFSKQEGWIFHEAALMKESTEGRDAVRGAFKELLENGWLAKLQPRQSGKFKHNVYRLTVDWKSGDGSTDDGKTPLSNTIGNKKDRESTRAQRLEDYLGKEPSLPSPWGEWAAFDLCWSAARCLEVWVVFRDYWRAQSGQKGVKADWEATWRNWCRRESQFQKPPAKGEVRVRETTPEEKQAADRRKAFMEFAREHPGKSDAEIAALFERAA